MDFIFRTWIINIVAIGFLGVVIDLMLSDSEFRKYIRFVIGLIMLIAIVRPLLLLLNNPPEFDGWLFERAAEADIEVLQEESKERTAVIEARIINTFVENLQNQIEEQANMLIGRRSIEARVEFRKDDEGKFDINSIEGIWLTISNEEQNDDDMPEINVPKIEIGNEQGSIDHSAYNDEANVIRQKLSAMYNVEEKIIHITYEGMEYAEP